MADNLVQINTGLADAERVVGRYQGVVADLQADVRTLRDRLPTWLTWASVGISLVLLWLGTAQLGLLIQGLGMIERSRAVPGPPALRTELVEPVEETTTREEPG
jgi:hypothetical protein